MKITPNCCFKCDEFYMNLYEIGCCVCLRGCVFVRQPMGSFEKAKSGKSEDDRKLCLN